MALEALRLTATGDGRVRVEVRVKPRARASSIAGEREGALVVQLAAPPVDGAANAALVETLAAALSVPKRDVTLVRGASARVKLVEVRGLLPAAVRERLGAAVT